MADTPKRFLITSQPGSQQVVGKIEIVPGDPVNNDKLMSDMVIAPGYVENEDGSVKIIEFSLVSRERLK